MIRGLRGFAAQTGPDRWQLLGLIVVPPLLELALRLLGFKRLARLTWRPVPAPLPTDEARAIVGNTERLARKVMRRQSLSYGRCLARSLTLARQLQRRGVPVTLQFGHRMDNGALKAHAWLEFEGRPVAEDKDVARTYRPFPAPMLES